MQGWLVVEFFFTLPSYFATKHFDVPNSIESLAKEAVLLVAN